MRYLISQEDYVVFAKEQAKKTDKAKLLHVLYCLFLLLLATGMAYVKQWGATVLLLVYIISFILSVIRFPETYAKTMKKAGSYFGEAEVNFIPEGILFMSGKNLLQLNSEGFISCFETNSYLSIKHNIGFSLLVPKRELSEHEVLAFKLLPQSNTSQ